jgi:L-alanine-DL-glutamate epimerase-like enolase superfamily enzyme
LRVELESGMVGWGESYGADLDALSSIVRNRVAPLAVGRDALDEGLGGSLDRALHLMGRSGPVVHALSGLDIALWDLRGKLEGVPVHALLGGARRKRVPAYASLLQYYGDVDAVRRNVARALGDGYTQVKLHEKTAEAVAAAREAMGDAMPLMVDVNCAWAFDEAVAAIRQLAPFAPAWIEEPIWPPEDTAALARLRQATGIPIAAGENASSLHELLADIVDRAVDHLQPSAIKAGGITTLARLSRASAGTPVRLSPHSAYFGPGFLATLHLLAVHPGDEPIERIYCSLGHVPYAASVPLERGFFPVPDRPGLGADPDPDLLDGPHVRQ